MGERRQRALVTGASAGIGTAFARELARRGYDLVLTARREERLSALAAELRSKHSIEADVVAADLADPETPARLHAQVSKQPLDLLVNNAGFAVGKSFVDTDWSEHERFLQVMIRATTELTHLFVRDMVERKSGYVLQIASVAGLLPGTPSSTLYGASKAYLIRFTESLSAELMGSGVGITAICPGLTETEFHDVTGTRDQEKAWAPPALWQTAEQVVIESLDAMRRGEVVRVTGGINRSVTWLMRHLPPSVARGILRPRR